MRFYVGNLRYSAHESALRDFIEANGFHCKKLTIVRDNGRSRGFAFAEIEGDPQAVMVQLSNLEFAGRAIRVQPATATPSRIKGAV